MENSAYQNNVFYRSNMFTNSPNQYNNSQSIESHYNQFNDRFLGYNNNFSTNIDQICDKFIDNRFSNNNQNLTNKIGIWSNKSINQSQFDDSSEIMFPMQLKSNWNYDYVKNVDISQNFQENRINQYNLVDNSLNNRSKVSLETLGDTLSTLNLSDNRFLIEKAEKKQSWALIVGKQEKNREIINKNVTETSILSIPTVKKARFFVIKSYSEDDVYRSIKYQIWCSTEAGNRKLDAAYRLSIVDKTPVYLFFSVNGSGHFCGVAEMIGEVDYKTRATVWSQGKWKGQFRVRWLQVKDVPNSQLRHIRIETNENKPVTNSRDVTEIPLERGRQVWRIFSSFKAASSIYDDFDHYEQRELCESSSNNT